MATTKIWNIKGRLDDVVNYANNPDKNKNPIHQVNAINSVINYATNKMKTQNPDFYTAQGMEENGKEYFVSGVNCTPATAIQEMNKYKKIWDDEDGIIAFHGYQSFAPNEVSPELAHEIGVKLAKELWGERFQVVVSTHLNSRCIHNHFVINSVSYKDGKRYYDTHASYDKMRLTSDRFCRENSLSVIQNPKRGRTVSYSAYLEENKNHPSKRNTIKADLDEIIQQSMTMKQFFVALKKQGYEYKTEGMYFRVKRKNDPKFFRVDRSDKNYSLQRIKERILENGTPPKEKDAKPQTKKFHFIGIFPLQPKKDSLLCLYLYYCYRLGFMQKHKEKRMQSSFSMREDMEKLNQFSEQTNLLFRYRLTTKEQVFAYKKNKEETIETLCQERVKLRNSLRGLENYKSKTEEIKADIASCSNQITKQRKEVKLCDAILQRSEQIRKNLQPQNEKEETKKEETKKEVILKDDFLYP